MLRSISGAVGGAAGCRRLMLGVFLGLALCVSATLWWRSKEHEDVFVVVRGHPVTWNILHKQMMAGGTAGGSPGSNGAGGGGGGGAAGDIEVNEAETQRIGHIDHIYVVHFEGEPERKQLLESTLTDHLGLTPGYFEFRGEWDSHNILSPSAIDVMARHHFSRAKDLLNKDNDGMIAMAGTLASEHDGYQHANLESEKMTHSHLIRMANWMQHYTGWVEMLAANYTALLVLENDAVLVEGFAEKLVQLWPSVPADYDVVYIGSCLGRHAPTFRRGFVSQVNGHVFRMNQHRCASGYVLSRKGAEKLLRAPPMIGMDNIDEWMQFHMSLEFDRVYWLEPVLLYEGTKSFLLPVFCSPRTSWLGCDPFWRPLSQCVLLGLLALLATMALLAYKSPRTWNMRLRRIKAFFCPGLYQMQQEKPRGRLSNSSLHLHPTHVHVHVHEPAE